MPLAARVTDATSHPGIIAGPGAPTVLINGLPAARVGDLHACTLAPPAGPHPPNPLAAGSTSVFIAGMPAARQGDATGCGATILAGASNVLIG